MQKYAVPIVAFVAGFVVCFLTRTPNPRAIHAPEYDTFTVTFPDPHHPDGRATHTLSVVGVYPADKPDVRGVHPDDWLVRHFDASAPQGGTVTYARVRPTP